jgi:hypothetical protein
VGEWYDKDDALAIARRRAKWDEDAAAIARAQDEIERQGVTFPPDMPPRAD